MCWKKFTRCESKLLDCNLKGRNVFGISNPILTDAGACMTWGRQKQPQQQRGYQWGNVEGINQQKVWLRKSFLQKTHHASLSILLLVAKYDNYWQNLINVVNLTDKINQQFFVSSGLLDTKNNSWKKITQTSAAQCDLKNQVDEIPGYYKLFKNFGSMEVDCCIMGSKTMPCEIDGFNWFFGINLL